MQFSGNFKGKPHILSKFWAQAPPWGHNSAGPPLTKILDPRLEGWILAKISSLTFCGGRNNVVKVWCGRWPTTQGGGSVSTFATKELCKEFHTNSQS